MGYTESSSMVRGDFFKNRGKWYVTEAIDMERVWDVTTAVHAVAGAWWAHQRFTTSEVMTLVVLEPYHRNAHPVMIRHESPLELVDDLRRWDPELMRVLDTLRSNKEHR